MKNNRPQVGVGVFVVKNGKILMGRRKNSHGDGTWGLTGGHLEKFESWEDCGKRETYEEANVFVKNIKYFCTTNDIFEDEQKHYVNIMLIGDYGGGELKLMEPDKFHEWRWFTLDNLPSPLFLSLDNCLQEYGDFLKEYLGKGK